MRGDEDASGQSKQRPCMPSLRTSADKASCGIDPLHPLHLTRARRSLRDDHDRRRRGQRLILPQGRGPELACYPEDKRCCWFHHHATHSHSHSGRFLVPDYGSSTATRRHCNHHCCHSITPRQQQQQHHLHRPPDSIVWRYTGTYPPVTIQPPGPRTQISGPSTHVGRTSAGA